MKLYPNLYLCLLLVIPFISIPAHAMRMQPTVDPEPLALPAPMPMVNNFLKPTDAEQKTLKSARSSSPHPNPRVLASRERAKTPTQGDQLQKATSPCSAVQEAHRRVQQDAPTAAYDAYHAADREKILVQAFATLPGKKMSKKQLRNKVHQLPLGVQKKIGRDFLNLTHNFVIQDQMKELMPAVIDHHTDDPDANIFRTINIVEKDLKNALARISANSDPVSFARQFKQKPVHQDFRAPLNDATIARLTQKFKEKRDTYPFFNGDHAEENAFIAHIMSNGKIHYFVNAENRNRLRALDQKQIQYLVGLYNAPHKLNFAHHNKKMHTSLPQAIRDQVEDNYEFTLPTGWAAWKCW